MCLVASESAYPADDAHRLAMLGGQMSREDKVLLEKQVEKNPDDVESRTKLLGYYFIKGRQDADAKANKERHVVWLIEHAPESAVLGSPYGQLNKLLEPKGYEQAKQAWQRVIEESPEKLAALKNASAFFLIHDREISEELLLKGQQLDPEDPKWPDSLGQLYSLELMSPSDESLRKATAKKAYDQYELAYGLSTGEERDSLLTRLAKSALTAGLKGDAEKFATMMLDNDAAGWNRGNRVHQGNLILGQIALADGNVDEAKSRLLLAGKTDGSPQLNSFGPNMLLAKELLERGESEVVLEYFALCQKFWKSGSQTLKLWSNDVKSNRIPEFAGNLTY